MSPMYSARPRSSSSIRVGIGLVAGLILSGVSASAQLYSENFNSGTASGWTVASGTYAVVSGTYNCTSNTAGPNVTYYNNGSWDTGVTYTASVRLWGSGSGNQTGLVYNYQNSTNYYEVELNPITPTGTVQLYEHINSAAGTIVATGTFASSGGGNFQTVTIARSGTTTTIKVNGTTVITRVQTGLTGGGKIGLACRWGLGWFDNISVTDTTAPTVSVTSPANNAQVSGTINVNATAADNIAVAGVQFKLDGANLGTQDTISPYSVSWDTTTATPGSHTLTAVATDTSGNATTSAAVAVTVLGSLPSGWTSQDIGSPGATGSASYSNGTYTVSGAGTGIWNTSDEFRFVYQPLTGDGSIVARVASVQNTGQTAGWEHGGVMLRESLNTDSTYAGLYETSTRGILFEARTSTGGSAIGVAADSSHGCPYWLKLVRSGNLFTAYTSADGSTWATLGSQSIPMASTIYVGLAVTSQVSATLCTAEFDNVTAGAGDFTPPTVSMTAPSGGAYLKGSGVAVSASASDNVGVSSVQFQLDGSNLGSAETTSPYSIIWDTTTATDGSHSLTAIAYDAAGNHTTSSAISVTVDNTAPTVSITAPTNNAAVSGGAVTVSANAADNIGVAGVQFQLDGTNLGALDTTAPYGISWDTTTVSDGTHSLTAVAYDAAGNAASSTAVNVTVSNLPSPWQTGDIGAVGATGSASYSGGTYTVSGAGTGIWNTSDEFRFVYQPLTGDGSIVARVASVQNTGQTAGWEHGGVMLRESLNTDSTYAGLYETSTRGILFEARTSTGGSAIGVAADSSHGCPYWLKLVRSGNLFTAYTSADGSTWATLGSQSIPMASTIYVGLAVTSQVSATLCTAVFDQVTVAAGGAGPYVYTTPSSYAENFDQGTAANWSATAGTWAVGAVQNGTVYESTSASGTSVLTNTTWNTDYVLRAALESNSAGGGAAVGLLYNYVDGTHYYKVLFAADGSARMLENNGGGETTIASAPAGTYQGYYTGSGSNPWVDVEVERSGTLTTVRANGWRLFDDVSQTDLSAGGIGLANSGTTASFDNVSVTPTPVVAYAEDFSSGTAANFALGAGVWSVANGCFQSTSGGPHDYAVYTSAAWDTNYTYSVSVASTLTGSANKMGAIYNYVDPSNYYEVLLDGSGTAEIQKVVNGVTTSQGTASYVGAGGGTNRSTKQWIEVRILRSGTSTTVNVNGRRVFTAVPQADLGAGEIGVSAVSDTGANFDDLSVTNGLDATKNTFPKIAGIFNGAKVYDQTSAQQALARHDFVMIGIYNGWNGGGSAAETAVAAMKSYNPALLVANYTDVMELASPQTSGQADYDCYSKLSSEVGPNNGGTWLPNDWWARDQNGANVSEYAGTNETNVTHWVVPDADGWRYTQWFAQRNKTLLFDPVPSYDMVYDDNVFCQPRPPGSLIDWDRNGVNDSSTNATVMATYRAGIADYLMRFSQLAPQLLVMGNAGGSGSFPDSRGYLQAPEYQDLVGASLDESAMGMSYSPESWAGWSDAMSGYQSQMDNTRSPHLVMFGVDGTSDGKAYEPTIQANYGGGATYAFMRYALASSLMENGYFAYSPGNYTISNYLWFDEFDVYLGEPEEGPQRTAWSNGVFKREFQNGLVLVNPRGNGDQTVDLSTLGVYKRISGTQDPATNDGATITAPFILKQGDGLILLKQ